MYRKAREITKQFPQQKGSLSKSAQAHKQPSGQRPGAHKRDQRFHSSKRRATERTLQQEVTGAVREPEFYEDLDLRPTRADRRTLSEERLAARKAA